MTSHVGVLELASKYRYGLTSRGHPMYLFRPYDEAAPDMIVGCSERDTSQNQIAIVEAVVAAAAKPGQKPRGNLVRLLGPVGSRDAEEAGLLAHYCPCRPSTSRDPAHLTGDDRPLLAAETGWYTFHVDPPGCRDIDDAIAWSVGEQRWAITIADVASAVPAGSATDKAAQSIGQTFYDLDGRVVRPMLPPELSEEACSLIPGTIRPGVTAYFSADGSACLGWELTCIRVDHSFDYDGFTPSAIPGGPPSHTADSHDWIAHWMIRYNAAAAQRLLSRSAGLLRTQSEPAAAAVAAWKHIPALAHMAHEVAEYTPAASTVRGHAGLGLSAYAHASSPIRRYADLVNQRILAGHDGSGAAASAELAAHLNQRVAAGRRWTRDLTFLKYVRPNCVLTVSTVVVDTERVWVPDWRRLLRLRHVETPVPGATLTIRVFCDTTRRNWKQRVLTASDS